MKGDRFDVPAIQEYFTTSQAAVMLGSTVEALRKHVERGSLVPDAWGSRGRLKEHRFKRETLERFLRRAA